MIIAIGLLDAQLKFILTHNIVDGSVSLNFDEFFSQKKYSRITLDMIFFLLCLSNFKGNGIKNTFWLLALLSIGIVFLLPL
jgi:hypothetical protein